jgi:hypothetical protein
MTNKNNKIFYVWKDFKNVNSLFKILNVISKNKNSKLLFINPEEYELFLGCLRNCSSNETEFPKNKFKKIEQELIKNNVKIDYIIGSFSSSFPKNFYIENFRIIYWPTFMMHYSDFFIDYSSILDVTDINKLFISLNHRSRPNRRFFIDQIYKNKLSDYGYISWHNADIEDEKSEKFKYFHGKTMRLDHFKFNGILPREYFQSLINVISESSVYNLDISEKTWYAIIGKKPFITLAARDYYKTLRKLGFQLYYELFDYEFDKYNCYKQRAKSISEQLSQLKDIDLNKTYKTLLPKIEYNYNHFYNLLYDKSLIPDEYFTYKDQIYKNNNYGYYDTIYERFK